MSAHRVEVQERGREPRQVDVDGVLEVGRECDGLVVADDRVSRRHLRLRSTPQGVTAVDLGSTNGTAVNGVAISGETLLSPGDKVTIGDTEITLLASVTAAPATIAPRSPGSGEVAVSAAGPRPMLDELAARSTEAAVVRYRPGSPGQAAAAGVETAVRRARKRLAGLGSEPWGTRPQVCLVDPFPDPERPGQIVAAGTVVDTDRGEIWMVVTAESPPEPPERALALVFGAALPAAGDLRLLLEGYGLSVADPPDPDGQLRRLELPPLAASDGELRAAMALSFVRYLIERGGVDEFRRLLAAAQPGRLDAAAQEAYGAGMAALEEGWRRKVAAGPPDMKTGQFVRMAGRYLRPHVRREAETFIYMLAGLAFTMIFPFAFRRLLDRAIPSGQFSQVVSILGLLGAAFVVSLVAGLRRAYVSAWVSGSVVRQIRIEMFSRLQVLDAGWFTRHQEGDVLSRLFSDVGLLEQGLSQTLREGLFQALSLVVSAAVLLLLNPLLGVIVIAGAPFIALVYKAMAKGAQKRSIAVQEQVGALLAVTSENYGASSVVRAFGLEARERARFGRASDRLFGAQVRMQLFGGLFGLSVNMIVTALRLFVLGLGAWLILHRHLTVGGLVAFMGLMGEVLSPVTALTGIGQQIQASTGALLRINEVLEALPKVADAAESITLAPLEHEIRLDSIGFSYSPERRTLEEVTAVIAAGERVAFVGPTGAGKSSILQLLMRFYDPDEGTVRFDGRDIRTATVASLRSQLGVVFQDTFLFDMTVAENIAMGRPGASEAEIEAAARQAELHDFIVTLPRGYDTLVGERGGRLSGGQRQRLAIARALLRDPRILLLDEATSALDPRTERLIASTLQRVGEGRTTIAVTHRLTSITDYDRIFVVSAGKLVERGTHDELVSRGGLYAQLWAEQNGGHLPAAAASGSFDLMGALARIPLFAQLSQVQLAAVAGQLRAFDLAAGQIMAEGGGRLVVVRRGRAQVLTPGLTGELAPTAELGPGDTFGLAALLGQETGVVLRATDRLSLLALDDEVIAGLAATLPDVAAALEGSRPSAPVAPAAGLRLARMSMMLGRPSSSEPGAGPDHDGGPAGREVRRLSASLPAVRR